MSTENPGTLTTESHTPEPKQTGLIAFFANNSVAANLMMMFIIVMGLWNYKLITSMLVPFIGGLLPKRLNKALSLKWKKHSKILLKLKKALPVPGAEAARLP
jgi:hypothetical protein